MPFLTFSRMGLVNTGTGFELMAGEPTLLRAYTAQAVCEEVDGEVQLRALAVEDPTNGRYYLHVHDPQDRPMKGLATHMTEVDPLVDIAILRAPVEGQKYYVFVRGADRKLHYLTVDMTLTGYSTANGQVTDAKVFGGLANVGRNMLARENRTIFGSRVLYVSTFEDTDGDGLGIMQMHTLRLEGADVNLQTSHWYEGDGTTPMVLNTYDAEGNGDMQLSTGGHYMYLHVQTSPAGLWGTAEWQVLSFQPYRGGLDWREDSYTARMRYRGPAPRAVLFQITACKSHKNSLSLSNNARAGVLSPARFPLRFPRICRNVLNVLKRLGFERIKLTPRRKRKRICLIELGLGSEYLCCFLRFRFCRRAVNVSPPTAVR